VDPNEKVVDSFDETSNNWRPCLRRNLNDWEMDELGRQLELFESIRTNPTMGDRWEWTVSEKGKFILKSFYLELRALGLGLFLIIAFGSWVSRQKSFF